jgi:hypothetical protein
VGNPSSLIRVSLPVLLATGALILVLPLVMAGDNVEGEARLKAAFIYNFARFVEWPGNSGSGPIRIRVLGHGDLALPLVDVVRGKSAGGHPIDIANISGISSADCCEILLIERSESKHLREIAASLAGKPVLTVCDGASCYRDGAMIAFQLVDDSVRFQINQDAAEHAGLRISSQLLKVALAKGGKPQ